MYLHGCQRSTLGAAQVNPPPQDWLALSRLLVYISFIVLIVYFVLTLASLLAMNSFIRVIYVSSKTVY